MTKISTSKYQAELARLYSLQDQICHDPYLHAHSRNTAVIRRQVSIFERCQDVIARSRTFLDWGCRHAADACMVRLLCGPEVRLYGCDVDPPKYQAFYDFAGLEYAQLSHPFQLPYEDNFFDVVIGSGVLEHVPLDFESLKELYRIVKPEGHLIVTMLPNRHSYTEWLNRTLKNPHHLRMYSLGEARHMLIHHGFLPVRYGYHQVLPTLSSLNGGIFDHPLANKFAESVFDLNGILERTWPINKFSTNIFVIGKKVEAFHG